MEGSIRGEDFEKRYNLRARERKRAVKKEEKGKVTL